MERKDRMKRMSTVSLVKRVNVRMDDSLYWTLVESAGRLGYRSVPKYVRDVLACRVKEPIDSVLPQIARLEDTVRELSELDESTLANGPNAHDARVLSRIIVRLEQCIASIRETI